MSERHVSIGMTPVDDTTRIPMYLDVSRVVEAVSPHVTLTRTDGGVLITVVDVDGTKTATVYDGESPIVLSMTSNLFAVPCDNNGTVLEDYSSYATVVAYRGSEQVAVTYLGQSGNTSTAAIYSAPTPYGTRVYVDATKDRTLFNTSGQRCCDVTLAFSVDGKTILMSCEIIGMRDGKDGAGAVDVYMGTQTFNLPCDADGKITTTLLKYFWFNGRVNGAPAQNTILTSVIANQPAGGVTVRRFSDGASRGAGQIILQTTAGAYPFAQGTDVGTWSLDFTVDGVSVVKTFEVATIQTSEGLGLTVVDGKLCAVYEEVGT